MRRVRCPLRTERRRPRLPERVFVVGGARSGKSGFAQRLVESWSPHRLYVATLVSDPGDAEMQARIAGHRALRGPGWITVEAGSELASAITCAPEAGAVLVDSLSPWLAGLVCGISTADNRPLPDDLIEKRIDAFCEAFASSTRPVAVVSDETGLGLVPADPLSRRFRDWLGLCNQRVASAARDAYFVSCGIPVLLKGGRSAGCMF